MGKKNYSYHHEVPRSRGGERVVELPKEFHSAFHKVFQNLYGDECVRFIEEVNRMMLGDKITSNELHELRERIKGGR